MRWTQEEYEAWQRAHGQTAAPAPTPKPAKHAKYGNIPTEVDGKRFDSQHEAEVYQELMLRRRAGELWIVLRQVAFDLPGGIRYIADFVAIDYEGNVDVIDAKSEITKKNQTYINKKKQVQSEWGIQISEV